MKKLNIIYEDKEILVVNKPAKLLTIGNKNEKERTLYHQVREYINKKNQKVFIVHRLDKDTSGIVLFAKNEKIKNLLQANFQSYKREYVAVVEGKMEKKQDKIKVYLRESLTLQVYVSKDGKGMSAVTTYEVLNENKSFSLLKVNLKTGRKNQIRCSLSYIGHPIVGDKKYEAKTNILGRLGLHASRLEIIHPITKKKMEFVCDAPKTFYLGFKEN